MPTARAFHDHRVGEDGFHLVRRELLKAQQMFHRLHGVPKGI
jgi:hypothetical protein